MKIRCGECGAAADIRRVSADCTMRETLLKIEDDGWSKPVAYFDEPDINRADSTVLAFACSECGEPLKDGSGRRIVSVEGISEFMEDPETVRKFRFRSERVIEAGSEEEAREIFTDFCHNFAADAEVVEVFEQDSDYNR